MRNAVAIYKKQLCSFNLTVYDCDLNQAYCYIWHEAIAKRGGNDIGSCMYQYLTKDINTHVKHVIMYSDSCGGQNENCYISAMCIPALQNSNIELIDHKFLLPGHTHMECNTDHSLIEKQNFNGQIEPPHDWAPQLIRRQARKTISL